MRQGYNPNRDKDGKFATGSKKPVNPADTTDRFPASPATFSPQVEAPNLDEMQAVIRTRTAGYFPVPVIIWNEVTHIGTLDPSHREASSLEGEGLSVSINPDEWQQIAKLGGRPRWAITTDRPLRFIDAHKLTPKSRASINAWGVENGIVEEVTTYTAEWWDSDMEDRVAMVCSTREEADEQISWMLDDDSDDGPTVTETRHLQFTAAYQRRGGHLGNVEDLLLVEWAEGKGDVDGVWWNDELDPDNYSAPRGVLLPSRLQEYTYRSS